MAAAAAAYGDRQGVAGGGITGGSATTGGARAATAGLSQDELLHQVRSLQQQQQNMQLQHDTEQQQWKVRDNTTRTVIQNMALIASKCGATRPLRHQVALITSGCVEGGAGDAGAAGRPRTASELDRERQVSRGLQPRSRWRIRTAAVSEHVFGRQRPELGGLCPALQRGRRAGRLGAPVGGGEGDPPREHSGREEQGAAAAYSRKSLWRTPTAAVS